MLPYGLFQSPILTFASIMVGLSLIGIGKRVFNKIDHTKFLDYMLL
jgi:hypothetical protein